MTEVTLKDGTKIQLPSLPNYITVTGSGKLKFDRPVACSVKDFTKEHLQEIGEIWTMYLKSKKQ